jgi:hypothetical protein
VAATRQEDRADYAPPDTENKEADIRFSRGGRTVDF